MDTSVENFISIETFDVTFHSLKYLLVSSIVGLRNGKKITSKVNINFIFQNITCTIKYTSHPLTIITSYLSNYLIIPLIQTVRACSIQCSNYSLHFASNLPFMHTTNLFLHRQFDL